MRQKIGEKIIKGGSKRGLTFSDKHLEEIGLGTGSKFSFVVDQENHKVILSHADKGSTVCRKKSGEDYKPLIDIRSKDVVEQFKGSPKVRIEFFNDGTVEITQITSEGKAGKKVRTKVPDGILSDIIKPITPYIGLDIQMFAAMAALRIISFFSGAGLLDHSFVENGYEVVWANDIDRGAVKTYEHNIGDHIVHGDVKEIDKNKIPAGDVLVAGFPCVAFSNVNRSDTRNEKHQAAFLYREILDTLKCKRSIKIVAVENVSEFLTAGDGEFFREYKEGLEKLGFEVTWKVVVDKEYGGYSDRKRVLIIGSKIGPVIIPEPTHVSKFKTVGEAFKRHIKKSSPNQEDYSKAKEDTVARMKFVPQGGNWKDIPEHMRSKGTFHNYFRRLALDGQSPTLVNWRKSVILSPLHDRILSVREAAAIMGMPWDFEFLGTLAEKQQAVANGVTRAIGEMLAKTILKHWRKCDILPPLRT